MPRLAVAYYKGSTVLHHVLKALLPVFFDAAYDCLSYVVVLAPFASYGHSYSRGHHRRSNSFDVGKY